MEDAQKDQHNAHVATIAAAYLSNPSNPTDRGQIADVIRQIDAALKGAAEKGAAEKGAAEVEAAAPNAEKPSAAAIRKSVTPEHLISFIDGKPYKTLRRHLKIHGYSVESYRERYGLKSDYPMTSASYSAMRSSLAKARGLGQLRGRRPNETEGEVAPSLVTVEAAPAVAAAVAAPAAAKAAKAPRSAKPKAASPETAGASKRAVKIRAAASEPAVSPPPVRAAAEAAAAPVRLKSGAPRAKKAPPSAPTAKATRTRRVPKA